MLFELKLPGHQGDQRGVNGNTITVSALVPI